MDLAGHEIATFAFGSFWGAEAAFRHRPGVVETAVGYMGGHTDAPTFEEVATNTTGHAEVVQVRFDPTRVLYGNLLRIFWASHDATVVDRLDPANPRHRHRSAIFTHSPEQEEVARASVVALQRQTAQPLTTEVVPAGAFWVAEPEHQQKLENGEIYALESLPTRPQAQWRGPHLVRESAEVDVSVDTDVLRGEFGPAFGNPCSANLLWMALQQDGVHVGQALAALRGWRSEASADEREWEVDGVQMLADLRAAVGGVAVSAGSCEHLFLANFAAGNFRPLWSRATTLCRGAEAYRGDDGGLEFAILSGPVVPRLPPDRGRGHPSTPPLGPRMSTDPAGGPPGSWHEHVTEMQTELAPDGPDRRVVRWTAGRFDVGVVGNLDDERTLMALAGRSHTYLSVFEALCARPTDLEPTDQRVRPIQEQLTSGNGPPGRHEFPWVPPHLAIAIDGAVRAATRRGDTSREALLRSIMSYLPWPIQLRWALAVLDDLDTGRPELDQLELAVLRSMTLAPLSHAVMRTLWQWCRPDPSITYADVTLRLLDRGEASWVRGEIIGDVARIAVGVSFRWLSHVWARGLAVIDDHLVIDVDGPAEAQTLDVRAVAWQQPTDGRPTVLMARATTASWGGDNWHLGQD